MIPFLFEGKVVRVVVLDGRPWFVGKDVAERLGYADPTNAMKQHCKGVVKRHPLQTPGGEQNVRIIAEPDVYRLVIGSHLPNAQAFESLVFEKILPSIRRTGGYIAAAPDETPEQIMARAVLVANDTIARQKAVLAELANDNAAQAATIRVLEPKAEVLDAIVADTASDMSIREFWHATGFPLERQAHDWLDRQKWVYRPSGGGSLIVRADARRAGYVTEKVHSKGIKRSDGTIFFPISARITNAGLAEAKRRLLAERNAPPNPANDTRTKQGDLLAH